MFNQNQHQLDETQSSKHNILYDSTLHLVQSPFKMCTRAWVNATIHIQRSIDTKSLFVHMPGSNYIYFLMVTISLYYSFLYGVYCINFPLHINIYKIFASVSISGDVIVHHECQRTMQTDLFRVWPISMLIELRRHLNRLVLIKIEEQCKLIYLTQERWQNAISLVMCAKRFKQFC